MTRRTAPRPRTAEVNVLAILRGLVPDRHLSYGEALQIAELQANKLKEHFGIDSAEVPTELITELPRITVDYDPDMPVSGSAHWNGYRWVITLNSSEPPLRRRFSMMHELKHIIDHTTRHHLYGRDDDPAARQRAERAAYHFAACLLMPKRWVKRLWGEGTQAITQMAAAFEVSHQAMRYRLDQLGLVDPPERCRPDATQYQRARMEVAA